MQLLEGIAVSPGVAIGEALVIDNEGIRVPRRFVLRDAIEAEVLRWRAALAAVAGEIERHRDQVARQLGEQYGAIFSAHLQMLRDERLAVEVEDQIRHRCFAPEYAVSRTLRRLAKAFEQLDNRYLAERSNDLLDLEKKLLLHLVGERRQELSQLSRPVVVLAHNLTPSETASLNPRFCLGFATETGGLGGHTAIVAEALEIPAVVGLGRFLYDATGGDMVIVDGDQGRLILQPDQPTLDRYLREIEQHRSLAERLFALRDMPAETADGAPIELLANIEFPHEAAACLERGASGIGLYRTEFLYLAGGQEPTEQVQFEAYRQVAEAMGDRPVVIRTLDLGADKLAAVPLDEPERNPFLGLRSIRLSLRRRTEFRTQLRAVLRASVLGRIKLMFPLITTLRELRQAKMLLADVMEDLEEEGIPFNRQLEVGMMVEVPAAVILLDRFLPEVDFISLGTNDLIQYALAVDRSNKEVADLYHAADPAVLRLVQMTLDAAQRRQKSISLCGQMSGGGAYTMLLLGLGLRSLSVAPSAIPEIKQICRSVTLAQCEQIADRALGMDDAREIDTFLREELRKVAPELVASAS